MVPQFHAGFISILDQTKFHNFVGIVCGLLAYSQLESDAMLFIDLAKAVVQSVAVRQHQ